MRRRRTRPEMRRRCAVAEHLGRDFHDLRHRHRSRHACHRSGAAHHVPVICEQPHERDSGARRRDGARDAVSAFRCRHSDPSALLGLRPRRNHHVLIFKFGLVFYFAQTRGLTYELLAYLTLCETLVRLGAMGVAAAFALACGATPQSVWRQPSDDSQDRRHGRRGHHHHGGRHCSLPNSMLA